MSDWVSEWQGHLLSCSGQLKTNKIAFADKMAEETGEMSLQLVSWYCWAAGQIHANNFFLDVKHDFPVEILTSLSIQLLKYPIPPPRAFRASRKSGWRYLGNETSYLVSKGREKFWIYIKNKKMGFLCIFLDFSNELSHHCTVAWVTRPERPKGVKDVIKQARRAAT